MNNWHKITSFVLESQYGVNMVAWFVIIKKGEIVMMYMVLMITNPSVVVVPNRFLLLFSML